MPDTLNIKQKEDLDGNIDFMMKDPVLLTNGTTVIIVEEGVFLGVIIWVPIDGGTFHFTNTAGGVIAGLPNSTLKASTTRAGTFGVKNLPIAAGLKIVVASAVGVVMTGAATTT